MANRVVFLISFICICVCAVAQAKVYRWVDENGNVQFSDTPPIKKKPEPAATPKVVDTAPVATIQAVPPKKPWAEVCQSIVTDSLANANEALMAARQDLQAKRITSLRYEEVQHKLDSMKARLSEYACTTSKNKDRAFYECLEKKEGDILACKEA